MVHLDVRRVGRIPDGGWRVHGRDSHQHCTGKRARECAKRRGAKPAYTYLHSMPGQEWTGCPGWPPPKPCPMRQVRPRPGSGTAPERSWLPTPIGRITRVITDNGGCYRSAVFARAICEASRHQPIKPFTPRHNGKVERYQPILADELLDARVWESEDHRQHAIHVWNIHDNDHTPPPDTSHQPPDSTQASPTS